MKACITDGIQPTHSIARHKCFQLKIHLYTTNTSKILTGNILTNTEIVSVQGSGTGKFFTEYMPPDAPGIYVQVKL